MTSETDVVEHEMYKIVFALEKDEDDYPSGTYESLWARKVEDGYMIDNTPFFVLSIAWGDVVEAEEVDGEFQFRKIVRESGHGTIRVVLHDPSDLATVRADLKALGCKSERSHIPRLISVDVPPGIDIEALLSYLKEGEATGRFEYEEGCVSW